MPSLIAKVGIAMMISPEGVRAPLSEHSNRSSSVDDAPQAPADVGTSGLIPATCFKNPLLLTHGYPTHHLQRVAQH